MKNPIQYTSRSFQSILNDIDSDSELVDKPNWFKRIWAGIGDVLNFILDAFANQTYLRTAFTRRAVSDLLQLIDYSIAPHSTSSGNIIFYVNRSASFPVTIAQADLKAQSQGSLAVSSKSFEARTNKVMASTVETFSTDFASDNNLDITGTYITGDLVRVSSTTTLPSPLTEDTDYWIIKISTTEIRLAETLSDAYAGNEITLTDDGTGTHSIQLFSFSLTCYQQTTPNNPNSIGVSDGVTSWQEFNMPDLYILEDPVSLVINGFTWTRVDTLIDSISTDKHFMLTYNSDGSSVVSFGNGVYGAIPGNFDIYPSYSYGGRAISNVSTINKITIYSGSDANISGVSNSTTFTGGANEQSIEDAKVLGPLLLKTRDRFITTDDGVALAESYSGVAKAYIIRNKYGTLSAQVFVVPSGGGLPSTALKDAIHDELVSKSILESIYIVVSDPTYITIDITASMKVLPGYDYSDIEPYFLLALRLLTYEAAKEIVSDYNSNGISSVVDIINTKWSTSFSSSDYTQISKLIEAVSAPEFYTDIQQSDADGYIDSSVIGCDYVVFASPSFPITIGDGEIPTDGTMTLSEIV